MRQLVLVHTSTAVGGDALSHAPFLRYASQSRFEGGWRRRVALILDAPEIAEAAPAEIARYSVGLDASKDAAGVAQERQRMSREHDAFAACFATPVQIHVGRYGGRLAEPGALRIDRKASAMLVESFGKTFDVRECELRALSDGTFLVLMPRLEPVATFDPDDCLSDAVDACLPSGDGARRLRQLSSEIEIWLHTLGLNHERAALGLPPVTTLWLWGCGQAFRLPGSPQSADTSAAANSDLAVYSLDPFLRGAGKLLGAMVSDDSENSDDVSYSVETLLRQAANRTVAVSNTGMLADAVAAVRHGFIARLDVVTRTTVFTLRRRDFFKFWRRRARGAGVR